MEGKALYESMRLAGCDVKYMLVASKEEFIKAIDFVIHDFNQKKGKWATMPFIHISAHGDEDGIGLTSEERFYWYDFKIQIDKINSEIGFVPHFTQYSKFVSRIVLCFSSCRGFNGFKIWDKENICPFQSLVGPTVDLTWSDALTAFITFYHLVNVKERSFSEAVVQMNLSAGLSEEFQLYVSPEIGSKSN